MKNYKINKKLLFGMIGIVPILTPISISLLNNKINNYQENKNIKSLKNKKIITKPTTLEELRVADSKELAKLDKFDSRDYNIITKVKNQGWDNICWAYSIIGASEASMLLNGNVLNEEFNSKDKLDLSENNVAVSVNKRKKDADKLGLTWDDLISRPTFQGFNMLNGSQILLQQNSPIDDSKNWTEVNDSIAHTANIIEIPNKDINQIKEAIIKFGAVGFGYPMSYATHQMDREYYNNQVLNGDHRLWHAATIVGWDDNLDKSLWKDQQPTRNGGWIVKQSWGEGFGKNGYFYLSYDSIIETVLAYDYVKKDTYENSYYYDGQVDVTKSQYYNNNETKETSVIFPVKRASYNRQEFVKGINVGIYGKDVTVEASVYTDVKDVYPGNRLSTKNNPTSGTLATTKTVKFDNPGFWGIYTIDFGKEIEIKSGEYFSIVVKTTNSTKDSSVMFSYEPNSNNDLTFYKKDDLWENGGSYDSALVARIKALTITKKNDGQKVNDLIYSNANIDKTFIRYGSDEQKPKPIVNFDEQKLIENQDYRISYIEEMDSPSYIASDDVIIGSGKIKIEGIGQYSGETYAYYSIKVGKKPNIDFGTYQESSYGNSSKILITTNSANKYSDIYLPNGWKWIDPNLNLEVGENKNNYLKYEGEDAKYYRLTFFDAIVTKTSEIIDKTNINQAIISLTNTTSIEYTGQEIKPLVEVKLNTNILKKDQDYSLTYLNNINAGTATIIITGVNSYQGSKQMAFEIKKATNNTVSIAIENGKLIYSSRFGIPYLKYFNDAQGKNEIQGPPNLETYYVQAIVNETQNYNGAKSSIIEFNTKNNVIAQDISAANIQLIDSKTIYFNGYEQKPKIKVTHNNQELIENKDYQLIYLNSINAGTATIKVIGIGSYQGTKEFNFTIVKSQVTVDVSFNENGDVILNSPNMNTEHIKPIVKYYKDKECTIEMKEKPTLPGTYYARVTLEDSNNYEILNKNNNIKEFTITNKPNNQLSSGIITTIALITSTFGIALIVFLVYWFIKKRKRSN